MPEPILQIPLASDAIPLLGSLFGSRRGVWSPSLAWRPFLDPLTLHDSWFVLLVPLALFISISYKAVRRPRLERTLDCGYWRSVATMTVQIIVSMILLGAAMFAFIQWILPAVAP